MSILTLEDNMEGLIADYSIRDILHVLLNRELITVDEMEAGTPEFQAHNRLASLLQETYEQAEEMQV